jgi:hypothetical protein
MLNTHVINIGAELLVEFSAGNLYMIQSPLEFDQRMLLFSADGCYINFPFEDSIKIIPFFEQLATSDRERIILLLHEVYGFKVRTDDAFGKLLVIVFYKLELYRLVIIGLAGLGDNSIETCIKLLRAFISKEKSGVIILAKTSPHQVGKISVTVL